MSRSLQREGASAIKPLGEETPKAGRLLAKRTAVLAAAGVRTPVGRYVGSRHATYYPWISGISGRQVLGEQVEKAGPVGWRGVPREVLAALLGPLVDLHRMDPMELDLEPLDPWRRIAPRLAAIGPDGETSSHPGLSAGYHLLRGEFDHAIKRSCPLRQVPVHGDFHVGQLWFESPDARPWLLDLDELALGPTESDLGNFIAHLVTSEDLAATPPLAGFEALGPVVLELYQGLARAEVHPDLMRIYGAVALFRRAFKLREHGHPGRRVEAIFLATTRLAQASGAARASSKTRRPAGARRFQD